MKIDRSFVRGLPQSTLGASVARAMLTWARGLGLRITAEGVETVDQADFLRELGCDGLQGYLMGQPAPPDEAERHFKTTAS